MLFQAGIKKMMAARGYHPSRSAEEFTRHGQYARNIQYAYTKEFKSEHGRVVDLIFLAADMAAEQIVIGLFRENVSIENGVMQNSSVQIPLAKFSMDEFERKLDRLIPKGDPLSRHGDGTMIY